MAFAYRRRGIEARGESTLEARNDGYMKLINVKVVTSRHNNFVTEQKRRSGVPLMKQEGKGVVSAHLRCKAQGE